MQLHLPHFSWDSAQYAYAAFKTFGNDLFNAAAVPEVFRISFSLKIGRVVRELKVFCMNLTESDGEGLEENHRSPSPGTARPQTRPHHCQKSLGSDGASLRQLMTHQIFAFSCMSSVLTGL